MDHTQESSYRLTVLRYRFHILAAAWLLLTGAGFLRVSRQPYAQRLKMEQYETIFKGTTLGAALIGMTLAGSVNKRRSETASGVPH